MDNPKLIYTDEFTNSLYTDIHKKHRAHTNIHKKHREHTKKNYFYFLPFKREKLQIYKDIELFPKSSFFLMGFSRISFHYLSQILRLSSSRSFLMHVNSLDPSMLVFLHLLMHSWRIHWASPRYNLLRTSGVFH